MGTWDLQGSTDSAAVAWVVVAAFVKVEAGLQKAEECHHQVQYIIPVAAVAVVVARQQHCCSLGEAAV